MDTPHTVILHHPHEHPNGVEEHHRHPHHPSPRMEDDVRHQLMHHQHRVGSDGLRNDGLGREPIPNDPPQVPSGTPIGLHLMVDQATSPPRIKL